MWRNAPMRVLSLQGDLVDSYDPALKEHRTVCFLAFDGHCYMYRAVKRQKTLAAQDGKRALCGCGLTGACELDHVVPVRQASVQTLQALCGDCHRRRCERARSPRVWRAAWPPASWSTSGAPAPSGF